MVESFDIKLAQQNAELLNKIVELQQQLEQIKVCTTFKTCPLCKSGTLCEPHRQLSSKESVLIDELYEKLEKLQLDYDAEHARAEIAIVDLNNAKSQHKAFRDSVPRLLQNAKNETLEDYPRLLKRDQDHIAFIHKIASRLKIHPDSSIERVQSMVDDAIRKLLK